MMTKFLVAFGLITGIVQIGSAESLSFIERVSAPLATFKNPPKMAPVTAVAAGYARTFQTSGSRNVGVAIKPLIEYGVLTADVLTEIVGDKGVFGIGGSVRANRVLAAMIPEMAEAFTGKIPFIPFDVTYEMAFGAAGGYDTTRGEAVQMLYVTPELKF